MPRELLIILFDNVGFRVIGRHAGYDQWIAMNYIVVTEKDLIATGFYEEDVRNEFVESSSMIGMPLPRIYGMMMQMTL